MQLTWPNQALNCTLSQAQKFLADAAKAGFTDGVLAVNTMQTLAGEIVNMEVLDSTGQPAAAIPGWPLGDYRAAFCARFTSQRDAFRWLNINQCLLEIQNGQTMAEVVAVPVGETGAIQGSA